MLWYLWRLLGYNDEDDEEDKKDAEEEEKFIIEIKKDAEVFMRKEFDKKYAYRDVVDELRKILTPIDYN